jgi:hypothetical protein
MAGGAGVHTEASSQFWASAPDGAIVVAGLGACPWSGILHSCRPARSDALRQATDPSTGWSWKSNRRAARAAFMSGTLSPIDWVIKGPWPKPRAERPAAANGFVSRCLQPHCPPPRRHPAPPSRHYVLSTRYDSTHLQVMRCHDAPGDRVGFGDGYEIAGLVP